MPTPAERKALLFLAGVVVLGASVRVVRAARNDGSANSSNRQTLLAQLASVDSARAAPTHKAKGERPRTRKRVAGRSRQPVLSRADSIAAADSARGWVREPLSRSIDHELIARTLVVPGASPGPPIDLDVASESEIETLPRIGPTLARRIVADRTANGPFGSMTGFERVAGVGPSLAATLAERVTFSGTARPPNAVVDNRLRRFSPHSKSPRRERKK